MTSPAADPPQDDLVREIDALLRNQLAANYPLMAKLVQRARDRIVAGKEHNMVLATRLHDALQQLADLRQSPPNSLTGLTVEIVALRAQLAERDHQVHGYQRELEQRDIEIAELHLRLAKHPPNAEGPSK